MSLRLGLCGRSFLNSGEFLELPSRATLRLDESCTIPSQYSRGAVTFPCSCGRVFVSAGQVLVLPLRYFVRVDKPLALTSLTPLLVHPGCVDEHSLDYPSCCRYVSTSGRILFRFCVRGAVTIQLLGLIVIPAEVIRVAVTNQVVWIYSNFHCHSCFVVKF